ncbi:MAG: hypothetical protein M1840_006163 [Geoglossum simile]|nr:MAG: hypothetical protein M1840_006163 [Geoglossum simile]
MENILDHDYLYNPHDILRRGEQSHHGIPYHHLAKNPFHDLESSPEDWCVWAQPNEKADEYIPTTIQEQNFVAYLEVSTTKYTLIEDECLSNKVWLCEFYIRIPAQPRISVPSLAR